MEDLLLREGKCFESNALTEDEKKVVLKALNSSKSTKDKECFYNSQLLAIHDNSGKIEYWEGFTNLGVVTILHGFSVINNNVNDVTHDNVGEPILGILEGEKEYIGIRFDRELILERIRNGKDSTSFIDNWREEWLVLKRKWKG